MSIFAEFRRLSRSRMAMLSVTGLLFIPLLYSGMLIGAFWDPYGKLNELPVAVVNQDAGAVMDGKTVAAGKELTDRLQEEHNFKWAFTNREEAMQGLHDHRYALAFVIPQDFSERTTTLQSDRPEPAQLQYYVDDGWNYLNSKIGSEAANRLKEEVSKSVTKAYAQAVLDSVGQAVDGLKQAGDGAAKLADGAKTANEGAQRLHDNMAKLADGTLSIEQGLNKLKDGSVKVADGAHDTAAGGASLADGLKQLVDAQKKLADGASQSAAGATSLADGADRLRSGTEALAAGAADAHVGSQAAATGSEQLAAGLEQYAKAHGGMKDDAAFQKLLETAKQVAAGTGKLQQGVGQLDEGAKQLAAAQGQAADGAHQLQQGLQTLGGGLEQFGGKLSEASAGASKLATGAGELAAGADKLRDGIGSAGQGFRVVQDGTAKLAGGSQDLAGGLAKLTDGSQELSGKLSDATKDAGTVKNGDKQTDMFADPVSVDEHKLTQVPNYGTGMAPYFLSLGLYVGVLLSTVILPLRDSAGTYKSGLRWYLSKALIFAPVVLLQTVLADTVLLYGLGLKVPHVWAFYVVTAVIALAFMTIIQFFVSLADQIGRFIAVILLTLQLAASAGTYPVELLPGWLQAIHPWMPMSHTIEALRLVIKGAPASDILAPLSVLALYAVVFIGLTLAYFQLAFRHQKAVLAP
ncbi:YhgE/Pip domain-containing protein [Cohnella pontilimi]|uniref:YhgE/Pip domain-containing protein n=1 Tax=Cohnella pontilimi TaxID=2564100 RepID=A0A4U0FDD5_9BACL|nr:YhgE/Pip domain-containing protein [Cohnella pontilimi]TJY42777.1 YhgE/Pip domain-containing protein [Cohnella pontilimi]